MLVLPMSNLYISHTHLKLTTKKNGYRESEDLEHFIFFKDFLCHQGFTFTMRTSFKYIDVAANAITRIVFLAMLYYLVPTDTMGHVSTFIAFCFSNTDSRTDIMKTVLFGITEVT